MSQPNNNSPLWGPDNPHPLSRLKTELDWEGKSDEDGNLFGSDGRLAALPQPRDRIGDGIHHF